MSFKEEIKNHCILLYQNILKKSYQRINDLRNDLESESKSSAGDKHETGRAMIQLEIEQQGNQLQKIEIQLAQLQNLPHNNSDSVGLGSLVNTNIGRFFIAVSMGNVEVANQKFIVISQQSPIGETLMNKKKGDTYQFRDKQIEILEVL